MKDIAGSANSFYVADLSNNIRALLNALGSITNQNWATAFGMTINQSGPATNNPYWFDGVDGVKFQGANLSYARARELDRAVGVFLSTDPVGFVGGDWNLYRYVMNGPLTIFDPSGLIPVAAVVCGGLAEGIGLACITALGPQAFECALGCLGLPPCVAACWAAIVLECLAVAIVVLLLCLYTFYHTWPFPLPVKNQPLPGLGPIQIPCGSLLPMPSLPMLSAPSLRSSSTPSLGGFATPAITIESTKFP
jgi:RHS repeat-associated protein